MHAHQSSAAMIEAAQMAACPLKQVLQSSKPTRNALFSTAQEKTNVCNVKRSLCCRRAAKYSAERQQSVWRCVDCPFSDWQVFIGASNCLC